MSCAYHASPSCAVYAVHIVFLNVIVLTTLGEERKHPSSSVRYFLHSMLFPLSLAALGTNSDLSLNVNISDTEVCFHIAW